MTALLALPHVLQLGLMFLVAHFEGLAVRSLAKLASPPEAASFVSTIYTLATVQCTLLGINDERNEIKGF